MTEPLATFNDVQDHLPFTMTEAEQRECSGALVDLSDEARYYGSPTWATPGSTPPQVVNMVLKAARRHMKNYEGYISNRAGDESVAWAQPQSVDEVGSAHFSSQERQVLAGMAGRTSNSLYSVGSYAWQTVTRPQGVGYVPGGSEMFPLFSDPTEPW